MITPKQFLEEQLKEGANPENPAFVQLARQTANQVSQYKTMKAIDYGAGTGVYASEFAKAGFDVTAQDLWKVHRDFIKKTFPSLKVVAKPVKSDLMLFIEVSEHMTNTEIKVSIKAIDPKIILFSSTPNRTDGDIEWGHINIKTPIDWVKFWQGLGYKKIQDLTIPTPWAFLLEKI